MGEPVCFVPSMALLYCDTRVSLSLSFTSLRCVRKFCSARLLREPIVDLQSVRGRLSRQGRRSISGRDRPTTVKVVPTRLVVCIPSNFTSYRRKSFVVSGLWLLPAPSPPQQLLLQWYRDPQIRLREELKDPQGKFQHQLRGLP